MSSVLSDTSVIGTLVTDGTLSVHRIPIWSPLCVHFIPAEALSVLPVHPLRNAPRRLLAKILPYDHM